jgi:HEPN domain-containing protein
VLVAEGSVGDEIIGFHAQQAVEKALKSVIVLAGVEIPRSHNTGLLLALLEDAGWDIPEGLRDLGWLTDWAVTTRYEAPPAELDRAAAMSAADAAVAWAAEQLSSAAEDAEANGD